ncbi:MAG TPA: polyphosphate kinase 2 family protein [Anaerolineales bacterium]|nr:polyphosphate kinase 2 family protein [Anaerolineales bacterium]HRF46776.1 polyphosphate kinase 2 family protein [Anaerolineales bacterium]
MKIHRVKPKRKIRLSKVDAAATPGFKGDKAEGEARLAKLADRLNALQDVMFAEGKQRLLVVLQAMDTGGKDGTIRSVFAKVGQQGARVANFKAPTSTELAHDYLWRVHQQAPARGEIVIFNRSHYEDVLVVRVHELVPRAVWRRRYDQINAFERMLAEEGTTIVKFFLHISRAEQKERLEARLAEPDKHWKFNPGDLKEREYWDDYQAAYEDVLNKTSTPWAPWFVVPADRKWYRDLVVAEALIEALEGLNMAYPKADFDPKAMVVPD